MSLFGDSDEPDAGTKSALFESEASPSPAPRASSSLFADDDGKEDDAPWTTPASRRTARASPVATLLPAYDVPGKYQVWYDELLGAGYSVGNGISVTGVKKTLASSGLEAAAQTTIFNIVLPLGQESTAGLGRPEINVLQALIAVAQEGDDITLDGVHDRRRNLPLPRLDRSVAFESIDTGRDSRPTEALNPPNTPPAKRDTNNARTAPQQQARPDDYSQSDPWASPELHKGHDHSRKSNGVEAKNSSAASGGARIDSSRPDPSRDRLVEGNQVEESPTVRSGSEGGQAGWAGHGENDDDVFRDSGVGDDDRAAGPVGRTIGSRTTDRGTNEIITVTAIPEKEGIFLFQHRNYEVSSVRRNSKVVRRFSDFVWLLDCLHKRYPFRQLPLLPPKRVAINGNHIATNNHFLEKRRRGLARFTTALVRHPVFNHEQLVVMFLTVPTELSVWRKQASITVQEEFAGKTLPPNLEESLPHDLQETLDTVRSGVRRSAALYIQLCQAAERLAKRNEGMAVEHLRLSVALQSVAEASADTYAIDTNEVPLLNEGLNATARHLSTSHTLLEDETKAWDEGVIEDLKRQRDCLVSVCELFDRRERYDNDNIPQLEKRIQGNESKLAAIRTKAEQRPGEAEKVEEAILRDKRSIVDQHARGVFVKECIRDELLFFQESQFHVGRLHQDWSQEHVKYAELHADNWRALSEEIESMPHGD